MSEIAIVCVVLGVLIIATRGPLIFAPEQTLGVYRRVIQSDAGVRVIGILVGAIGAALVLAGRGPEASWTAVLLVVAAFLASFAALMLLWPSLFRRLAETMLDIVSDSTVLRAVGVLAVALGAGLIYLGLRVL